MANSKGLIQNITETVKGFFAQEPQKIETSAVPVTNILDDLSTTEISKNYFFDNGQGFSTRSATDAVERQKNKIDTYRTISKQAEVTDAIDEIVNEIIFSFDDETPLKITITEENEKIANLLETTFQEVLTLTNTNEKLYGLVRNSFIDGQIILHTPYNKDDVKSGISSVKMLDPSYFVFDPKINAYKYIKKTSGGMLFDNGNDPDSIYSKEEIVHLNFGMMENGVSLSYLERSIKVANQLRTLEDLLIPLRFSRSVSRRVFNVDIGDLAANKAEEATTTLQNKFKYSKYYNVETGEISNQQHVTSMVEDYWFTNRSGGRGTTVETLDETGNLGELNDILYFHKKLYRSLSVPSNRISLIEPTDNDFSESRVTKEDVKFFMFISRLRTIYIRLYKELLKRQLLAKGLMKPKEWEDMSSKIKIYFTNENLFIEKMNIDLFNSKVDIFTQHQEAGGKILPIDTMYTEIFKYSAEEIEEHLKKMKDESQNPLYSQFYPTQDM